VRSEEIPGPVYKEHIAETSALEYYDLRIEVENGQEELLKHNLASAEQYDKRVKYYSFGLQNDVFLVNGADTLPCVMTHFERAFDIAPYATFQLAFPKQKDSTSDKIIIVHDKIFEKGILKFLFHEKDIEHLPKLKLHDS
jgi:hypothetical protein